MLRSLQRHGPVTVYVGSASPGFIESLGVRPIDTVDSSFPRFIARLTQAAIRGQAAFAFNPGEIRCTRRQALMHAALLPALAAIRARGSSVIRIGVGTRDFTPVWGRLIWLTTLFGTNIWRDAYSRDQFRRGTIAPDWAFGEAAPAGDPSTGRTHLAVTLRSDRQAPTDAWIQGVRSAAAELRLRLVVVTQVRRDGPTDQLLASRLGCEHRAWPDDRSHSDQESVVRATYKASCVVISDRLHALVMALTEGAIPTGVVEHPNAKAKRHFAVVDLAELFADVDGQSISAIHAAIVSVAGAVPDLDRRAQAAMTQVDLLDSVVDRELVCAAVSN